MFFNNTLGLQEVNKGDYKFPGGGANEEEIHEETLKREVREEYVKYKGCCGFHRSSLL